MAGEQLKTFMMGLGFQLDTAGMAKLEAFVKNTEAYAKQSAANIDRLVKTLEGYTKGLNRTTSEANKHKQSQDKQAQAAKEFCKQIEECVKGLTKSVGELGKHREEQDKNTRSTDHATDSLRRHGVQHHAMRETWKISKEAVLGFVGALTALAVTGEEAVRRVSREFSNLYYMAQRTGVSAKGIETLRFQFEKIGLSAEQADATIGGLASRMRSQPGLITQISGWVGPIKNAGDAILKLGKEYANVIKVHGEFSAGEAQFRSVLESMGLDPDLILQTAKNIDVTAKAAYRFKDLLKQLGYGDGQAALDKLQENSVKFQRTWVDFRWVVGKVWESFAGALMPGLTRLLEAFVGSFGNVETGFDELCKSFDGFIKNLVGDNGEKLKQWMTDVGAFFKNLGSKENLESLNEALRGTASAIGSIASAIAWIAKHPEIAGALLGGAVGSRAGPVGGVVGTILGAFAGRGISRSQEVAADPAKAEQAKRQEDEFQKGTYGSPIGHLFNSIFGGAPKMAAGGIVPINAHAGEAILPASLTRMLLRAANQPQPFNAARGQDSITEVLERLANEFSQWWSGSASFNPIVQIAGEFYDRLDGLLHQLLVDFGFEQKPAGGSGAGGGGGGGAGTEGGEGGGGGAARPGGRFSGMGPGAGGSGEGANAPGAGGLDRSAFAAELKNNPALREKILRIAHNEQGENPEGTQAVLESMMNRAQVHGTTLERQARWTGEGGYYAQGGMGKGALENERSKAVLEKSLESALGGGNISNFATDNASGALAQKRIANNEMTKTFASGGETFFSPGRVSGAGIQRNYAKWRENLARTDKTAGGEGGVPESGGGRVKELQGRLAAIRKLPLAARLKAQLEYAAEQAQVVAEVFSGGQHEHGREGIDRTGSHRHDKGDAGDVQLRDPKTGQLLDMRNPADQARMAQFVKASVAAGATGVGGAEGYMGAHGLHIGGGTAGTWGASTRFGTAPKWLSDAYREGVAERANMRGKLGTENRQMDRNLGTEKPAWRNERRADAENGDYGGGSDRQVVHKSETTINVVGAADPHGTARAARDLQDRNSPLQKRGRQTNFA